MTNEIVQYEGGGQVAVIQRYVSVTEILQRIAIIDEVKKHVMKEGVHYGKVPGCGEKPSLFQPGAEKLLETFQLGARHEIFDLSTTDIVHYRVRVEIINIANGAVLGDEWGECSSDEDKYAWRKAVCDGEFDATPTDRKREKWMKGWQGAKDYTVKQIRCNPRDSANTVLAMACKRGKVRAARAVLALSDIFNINVEDIPAEMREQAWEDGESERPAPSPSLQQHQNGTAKAQPAPRTAQPNIMDLLGQLGFTESGDDGKPKPSRAGFSLISKCEVPKSWKTWTDEDKAKVYRALYQAIDAKTQPAPATPAADLTHSDNQQPDPEWDANNPPEIPDPFADQ